MTPRRSSKRRASVAAAADSSLGSQSPRRSHSLRGSWCWFRRRLQLSAGSPRRRTTEGSARSPIPRAWLSFSLMDSPSTWTTAPRLLGLFRASGPEISAGPSSVPATRSSWDGARYGRVRSLAAPHGCSDRWSRPCLLRSPVRYGWSTTPVGASEKGPRRSAKSPRPVPSSEASLGRRPRVEFRSSGYQVAWHSRPVRASPCGVSTVTRSSGNWKEPDRDTSAMRRPAQSPGATTPACRCTSLLSLGADRTFSLPQAGWVVEPDSVRLSPDGRYVAVMATRGPVGTANPLGSLDVIDTRTGRVDIVEKRISEWTSLTWTSNSKKLFFASEHPLRHDRWGNHGSDRTHRDCTHSRSGHVGAVRGRQPFCGACANRSSSSRANECLSGLRGRIGQSSL